MSNVGFGVDATHTTSGGVNTAIDEGIDFNQHPTLMLRDGAADRYTFDHHFGGKWQRFPWPIVRLVKRAVGFSFRLLKKTFVGSRK